MTKAKSHILIKPVGTIPRMHNVYARSDSTLIGTCSYCPRWREYVFEPAPDTQWSAGCLDEVRWFLRRKNTEAKK